jgi:hypothetical protein
MTTQLGARSIARPTNRLATHDVDNWRELAACAGKNPNEWDFGTVKAKAICDGCPVAALCLADIMAVEAGPAEARSCMYAGLMPQDRAALARRNARKPVA